MADHSRGSFMGPRWPRSSCGSGAGLMAALSYSSPSRPCDYKSAMVEKTGVWAWHMQLSLPRARDGSVVTQHDLQALQIKHYIFYVTSHHITSHYITLHYININ
jgi:hypothetical protein